MQGLKEPNEPLTLTDSEEYALEYGLDMDEEKKLESQTNLFLFCSKALHAARAFQFPDHDFENSLSEELRDIYHEVLEISRAYHDKHQSSCCFHDLPNYGQCLSFVLQAVNLLKNDQLTPNPLAYLQEKRLPYLDRKTLHREERVTDHNSIEFLVANDIFFLVKYADQQTSAEEYQLDGTLVNQETFEGKKKILMSPGNEFVVVTPVRKGYIDILDATTLQTLTSFKPPNMIRSCHVFGNSQSWYIVTRCFNNKIYVLKGETGEEVGDPTVVQQNDEVLAVSNAGHILLGKTCISLRAGSNVEHIFVDEDENVCIQMVWNGNVIKYDRSYTRHFPPLGFQLPISYFASRELLLCDHKKLDRKIPIYARDNLRAYVCTCTRLQGLSVDSIESLEFFGQPVCFSDEGNLLAFYYGGFVTIVNTSDGSLFECFSTRPYLLSTVQDILFLSQERIVLEVDRKVFLFKIETGGGTALEHMLCLLPETRVCHFQVSSFFTVQSTQTLAPHTYMKNVESRFVSPGAYLYLMTCPNAGTDRMSCYFEKYEFYNLH